MERKTRLGNIMVSMIRHWQRGNEEACYNEYFALELEDRSLVRETFRQAMSEYPTAAARKDAKGIYRLLDKNLNKEGDLLTDKLENLLQQWFFSDRDTFYASYLTLSPEERNHIVGALREVIAGSDNEEFRQAAKDIPELLPSSKDCYFDANAIERRLNQLQPAEDAEVLSIEKAPSTTPI